MHMHRMGIALRMYFRDRWGRLSLQLLAMARGDVVINASAAGVADVPAPGDVNGFHLISRSQRMEEGTGNIRQSETRLRVCALRILLQVEIKSTM